MPWIHGLSSEVCHRLLAVPDATDPAYGPEPWACRLGGGSGREGVFTSVIGRPEGGHKASQNGLVGAQAGAGWLV